MKNIKNLTSCVAIAMIAMFSLTLVSCGGDDNEDPKPSNEKTDLEKVKEGIIGNWQLVSIDITKDGITEVFNGGCDESNLSAWAQANANDIDFNFTSTTSVSETVHCPSVSVVVSTYTVTEVSGKFYVTTDNGFKFEILTNPDNVDGSTVQAAIVTPKNSGITSAVWTFSK